MHFKRRLGFEPRPTDATFGGKQRDETGQAANWKAKWLAENNGTIAEWNDWVYQNELPLSRYRQF